MSPTRREGTKGGKETKLTSLDLLFLSLVLALSTSSSFHFYPRRLLRIVYPEPSPSLRNSTRSVNLWAAFTILPSSLNTPGHLIPVNSSYYLFFNSTEHSVNKFPAPWPVIGNTVEAQNLVEQTKSWKQQLARYPSIQNLLREVIPWVPEKEGSGGDEGTSDISIVDKTIVTMEQKKRKERTHAVISR